MIQTRVTVQIVAVGTDRLTKLAAPLVLQQCRTLSAAGSGRRRFGPLDKESDAQCIQSISTLSSLADALTLPSDITIVLGHGGWGSCSDWEIGTTPYNPLGPMHELITIASARPPVAAGLLIVNACHSHSASSAWKQLLRPGGVLVTANGEPGSHNFARWITCLLNCLSGIPGDRKLASSDYMEAVSMTEDVLELIDARTNSRQIRPEYVAEIA